VNELISVLERGAKELTNRVLEFSRHAGRKKVTADDMKMAITLTK